MNKIIDNIYAARILYLLIKPFKEQAAFKEGIIDANGNQLKKPKTDKEKDSYTLLHRIVFNLKRIIDKLPGGSTKIIQLAVALHLLSQNQIPAQYKESIDESYDGLTTKYLKQLDFILENKLVMVLEEAVIKKALRAIDEDDGAPDGAPASSAPSSATPPTASVMNSVKGIEPVNAPMIDPKKLKKERNAIISRASL